MKEICKFVGLERVGKDIIATCEPLDVEMTFKSPIMMKIEKKEALWQLVKDNWHERVFCKIHCESVINKIPQKPIVTMIMFEF